MERRVSARTKGLGQHHRLDFLSASSIRESNNFEYNRIVFRHAAFCNKLPVVSVLFITPTSPSLFMYCVQVRLQIVVTQHVVTSCSRTRTRQTPCFPNTPRASFRSCQRAARRGPRIDQATALRSIAPPAHCRDDRREQCRTSHKLAEHR